ncbi:MAG: hypothetical protein AAF563_22100 [Pseudomonadota bacterium]
MTAVYAENLSSVDGERKPQEQTDREIADELLVKLHEFQEAMDRAILAGLIVEPSFRRVENRFIKVGVSSDSYIVKCQVYRKLS